MPGLKFLQYLKPSCIVPRLKATTKKEAIEELILRVQEEGLIEDAEVARRNVFERESQMSTGLKDGLAVPHAKSAAARDMAVALGLSPQGIEFDSLDGQPARIIFLVLSRTDKAGAHLECLAEIARLHAVPSVRDSLLAADSAEAVLAALRAVV